MNKWNFKTFIREHVENLFQFYSKNKWIVNWILLSVLFMLIVHILFLISGPNWLQARWGAGEVLTYVSTVSLSLLAVWQNKRFKEENDKSQERLEQIYQKANELEIINKILENEEHRIEVMINALDEFDGYADFQRIAVFMRQCLHDKNVIIGMTEWQTKLENAYSAANRELKKESFVLNEEVKTKMECYFHSAEDVVFKAIHTGGVLHERDTMKLTENRLKFLESKNNYLEEVDKVHSHLLLDNVTLSEIREMRITHMTNK